MPFLTQALIAGVMPRNRKFTLSVLLLAFVLAVCSLTIAARSVFLLQNLSETLDEKENSVRENAVWSAFTIERETGELEHALKLFRHKIQGTTESDLSQRLDILLSSHPNLFVANLKEPFNSNTEYTNMVGGVISRLHDLENKYGNTFENGPVDEATLQSLSTDVSDLREMTKVMASLTNDIQEAKKAQNRKETRKRFSTLIFQITEVATLLCIVVGLMARQLSKTRKTNEKLEQLNIKLGNANTRSEEAAAEAQAGSRAKTVFLAVMSHEIRTPLNGIIGNVDLLEGPNLNRDQRESVETIRECGTSLLELIDDVLDFTRLEAGSIKLENRRFELGTVIESAVDIVSYRARAKGLGLIALYPRALLDGDEVRIRQILVNLCANAIKFTEHGDVVISVQRIAEEAGRAWLRFEVRDTGIGIPKDAQSKLFEEFKQLDASIKRKYGGSGLGLAICRRLITAMEGKIGVESDTGKGSCFWFSLPIAEEIPVAPIDIIWPTETLRLATISPMAGEVMRREWGESRMIPYRATDQNAVNPSSEWAMIDVRNLRSTTVSGIDPTRMLVYGYEAGKYHEAAVVVDGPLTTRRLQQALESPQKMRREVEAQMPRDHPMLLRGKVLLVEDNLVNQTVATKLLRKLGLTVEVTEDGAQAVERLEKGAVDLVIMDMQMPVMDGLEATRRIRKLRPDLASIPIVGLTANAFESDREDCLNAGMNDFFSKPVNREMLEAMVVKWCSNNRLSRDAGAELVGEPDHFENATCSSLQTLHLNGRVVQADLAATQESNHSDTPANSNPFVDWKRQQSIAEDLGPVMVVELVELFWKDFEQLLAELKQPTALSDSESTRRVFHTIKGTSEAVGFTAILEAASATRDTYLKLGILDLTPLQNAKAATRQFLEQVAASG